MRAATSRCSIDERFFFQLMVTLPMFFSLRLFALAAFAAMLAATPYIAFMPLRFSPRFRCRFQPHCLLLCYAAAIRYYRHGYAYDTPRAPYYAVTCCC